MSDFGLILKTIRRARGLSQSVLADRMDIRSGKQTISRWEHDKSEPSLSEIRKLADVLNAPIPAFFARIDELAEYGFDLEPVMAFSQTMNWEETSENESDSPVVEVDNPVSMKELLEMQNNIIKTQGIMLERLWKNE